MSIRDDAAQLRSLPVQPLMGITQQLQNELDNLMASAAQILGEGAAGFQEVAGAIQHAKEEVDGAFNALALIERALHDAAARHQG